MLFVLFLSMGMVSANEIGDDITSINDEFPIEIVDNISSVSVESPIESVNNIDCMNEDSNLDNSILQASSQEVIQSDDGVIVVNDWNELQYYCSLNDKDYTLKLKENTNFYPSDPHNPIYQIKIKNKVKIIGSAGAYIGDEPQNVRDIRFVAFLIEDNSKSASLNIENVTFKHIWSVYSVVGAGTRDGIFIQMGGKKNNIFKNCIFQDILSQYGHATIVYLKKGSAILDNCSFINCTSGYGAVSVYDPNSVKSTDMIVRNCYFESNYASTEPGCINNCGKLTVYNTTFVKNKSFWWAGAIHTHNGGNTTIYDSNFTDNVAGWNGGALYTYGYLQIYNSVFVGNNCTTNAGGGAIGACSYQTDPHIYIKNCLFKDNSNNCWATDELSNDLGNGGAIAFMDAGSLTILDSIFIANSAAYGTAIRAMDVATYGSPDIIIVNNSFINHTRHNDVLMVHVDGTILNVSNNYFEGNSIVFSKLTLTKLSEGREQATLQINASLKNPSYYDEDILDKTLYDVYINNKYVKTVNTSVFTVDFGDYDICDVYVIPTISNRKSNEVTITSTREYVFVSKSNGNDSNNGISRDTPVYTIKRALELANVCQNIILLDGDYSESDIQIEYGVTIKGEGNSTLTGTTSFISNANFTLKNLKIDNLNTENFIKQNKNNLIISNCIFTNNDAVLVYNNGFTSLTNSILLNNSKIVDGNINDCVLDYNWWGNVPSELSNYITLNLTSDVNALENNQKANVKAVFYLNDGNEYTNLPDINLGVTALNGVSSQSTVNIDSSIVYTLTAFSDGALTVSYNNINATKSFKFLKSNPSISLETNDILIGDNVVVTVTTPSDAEGNLTVNIGNLSQTKVIQSAKSTFTFENLKADTYNITVTYTGDKKYLSKELTSTVNVNKYESSTQLNLSTVNVGEDVIVTITTIATSTGNVTLSINNNSTTLTLTDCKANFTIKNIKRGDYLIRAVYNGDDKYLTSQDSKFIEVDNLNATMSIKTDDITYGDVAVIKVTLNDDASGNITVTIDGKSNQSKLSNGKAEVTFVNLDAGSNKNISVFYTGDDTYFNLTRTSTFNIAKADLTFSISSSDIKIGQFAEIVITVPSKTTGTFTIGEDVINIPMSGEISYVISDLEIGSYTYTATYNGNNYYTVSNSTSFVVSEYPIPQVSDEGFNTQNSHKSQYETTTNGNIAFTILFNETLSGDLVIDSFGNVYLPTQSGIYAFNQTSKLWYFTSTAAAGNLSGIAIIRDVIIAPKSGDTLYFINQTSGERWGESNIYQGSSFFAPVVDDGATLYIVSEYQFSSEDYKLTIVPYKLWEKGGDPTLVTIGNTQPLCSPTLNENIIVVVSDNRLRIIDAKSLQTLAIKSGNYMPIRPIIGEGNIVYALLSDSVVAYNGNGVQVWKTKVTGGVGSTIALDNDQGLYHINAKGIIYKYDIVDGTQSKFSNLKVTSGILIDANNNVYFGSNNIFYALDSEGNILWKSDLGSKIIGNPVMDASGLIYVPTENSITALTYAPLRNAINVTVGDIFIGQTAEVKITADSQIINKFTYTINGETFTSDGGTITKTLSNLDLGNYTVEVSYVGDARFASQNDVFTFEVKKFTPALTASAGNITVGETLVIRIDTNVTGVIYAIVDGNNYTAKNNIISIANLKADNYTASVVYVGDDKYNSITKELKFTVSKIGVFLGDALSISDDNTTFTVKLAGDATGSLTVSVDNIKYSENVKAGSAEVVIPKLSEGPHNIQITYSGDEKYLSDTKSIVLVGEKVIHENNTTDPIENTTNSTPGNDTNPNENTTAPYVNVSDDAFTIPENGSDFSISLPGDATGTLTVTVDGKSYSQNLTNGKATVTISELGVGSHNITVSYSGDSKYMPVSKSSVVVVNPVNATGNTTGNAIDGNNTGNTTGNATVPSVNVSDDAFTIPENGSDFSISLPGDATGMLTVTVDGKSYSQNLTNGKATVTISELGVGSHNITVSYSGDSKYVSVSKSSVVVVNPINATGNTTGNGTGGDNNSTAGNNTGNATVPSVNVSDDAFSIPENGSDYSISLPGDATGTLTVTVDGKSYSQNLTNGKATVTIPELGVGSHNITVSYSGDSKYVPTSKSSVVVINPVNTTGNNTGNITDGNYTGNTTGNATGNTTAPSVNVSDDAFTIPASGNEYSISLPSDATGTLTVTVDGVPYSQNLTNGKATVTIPELGEGSHNITVTYSGDGKYAPTSKSSVVVKEHVPVLKLTASNLSMLYTSGKYFKVKLTSDGKPLTNKKVKIRINGKTYTRTTDKNGYASIKISLAPKAYTVKATYGDLTITKKVTVKSIIKAKNVKTKRSAKTIKIKVTLKKVNGKYLKKKKVTLKFNKKTYKVKTNKKGVATFTIKNSVYKKLKVNKKYTYQVIYGKDKVKKTIKFKK